MEKIAIWGKWTLIPWLGPVGIAAVCFVDSSFLSLPQAGELLIVATAAAHPGAAWASAAMATLGSLAGCIVIWGLGRRGGEPFLSRRIGSRNAERIRKAFGRFGAWALMVPAVLPPPAPFKPFVFTAGVLGMPFRRFAISVTIARGLRYAIWAMLGVMLGRRAAPIVAAVQAWGAERMPLLVTALGVLIVLFLSAAMVRRLSRPAPTVEDSPPV